MNICSICPKPFAATIGGMVAAFITTSSTRAAPLTVEAKYYKDTYSEAENAAAYDSLKIHVELSQGPPPQDKTLDKDFRAKFAALSGNDVKAITWRLVLPDGGNPHSFVLWPLSVIGPLKDSCECFTLRAFGDLFVEHRDLAVSLTAKGYFQEADKEYRNFIQLFDLLPNGYTLEGTSAEFRQHSFLREMLDSAKKYRDRIAWSKLSSDDRKSRSDFEAEWRLELVTNNEGKTDQNSLRRLTEAASLWWEYAIQRDIALKKQWQQELYGQDDAFLTLENAKAFRGEFNQILKCFRNSDVLPVLDTQVAATLRQTFLAEDLRSKLKFWTAWKTLDDDNTFRFAGFEALINGLFTVYWFNLPNQVSSDVDVLKGGMWIDALGSPHGYAPKNKGSLAFLENVGGPGNWWDLVTDTGNSNGEPIVQGQTDPAPGFYISTTGLVDASKALTDPSRYVDAEQIPYVSVDPKLIPNSKLGDIWAVYNSTAGTLAFAVQANNGPAKAGIGGSIALARVLGINASAKTGGSKGGLSGISWLLPRMAQECERDSAYRPGTIHAMGWA